MSVSLSRRNLLVAGSAATGCAALHLGVARPRQLDILVRQSLAGEIPARDTLALLGWLRPDHAENWALRVFAWRPGQDPGGVCDVTLSGSSMGAIGLLANRELLKVAAAAWNVPPSECAVADRAVRHDATGRRAFCRIWTDFA